MEDKSNTASNTASSTTGSSQTRESKAKSIIEDVFRRADKNDDGSLSLEEFQTFFADGVLSSRELEELFRQIDTHKTNNLDTSELCEYFAKFWGPFEDIFATLDDFGSSISTAMNITAQQYSGQSFVEQFATRFLIKETLTHMAHLKQPLESALEKLEEQASRDKKPMEEAGSETLSKAVTRPRWQERVKKSLSGERSPSTGDTALGGEVGRLAQLIDKLENKVKLELVEEEQVALGTENTVIVVSRNVEASEETDKNFRQALKTYGEEVRARPGNLHVTVRAYEGTYRYMIYEVWQDSESLQRHYSSKQSKNFRRACVDTLVGPEDTKSFALPASWWPSEY